MTVLSDHDLARLQALVRSRLPTCSAAVVVGSAVVSRGTSVGDIDITGFDQSVPIGEDQSDISTFGDLPLHIVTYNPLQFQIITSDPDLTFLFLREIRKLLNGIVLFDDDGVLTQTLESFRTLKIPYDRLRPLVHTVSLYRPGTGGPAHERLAFYHAVENLTFAWMHFDLSYRYTKPKWLIDDAKLISKELVDLLESIGKELTNSGGLAEFVTQLRSYASDASETLLGHLCLNNLGDAQSLLRAGRDVEAVWPLRMSCYQFAELWAAQHELNYQDLRATESVCEHMRSSDELLGQLLDRVLLLSDPLNDEVLKHWNRTRAEFLAAWNQLEGVGEN